MSTSVTTYLCCRGASDAIDFYREAFGARELSRMPNPDGSLGHAEIVIGETTLYLADEWPEGNVFSPEHLGGAAASFVLHVLDADSVFARAITAGARVERPLRDEPFGRVGWLVDPFGHRWAVMSDASRTDA